MKKAKSMCLALGVLAGLAAVSAAQAPALVSKKVTLTELHCMGCAKKISKQAGAPRPTSTPSARWGRARCLRGTVRPQPCFPLTRGQDAGDEKSPARSPGTGVQPPLDLATGLVLHLRRPPQGGPLPQGV